MNKSIGKCGDANPNGNIALSYKGGCGLDLLISEAYRCTGCMGWFHKKCILAHFKMEKQHDWGRKKERKEVLEEIRKVCKDLMIGVPPTRTHNTPEDSYFNLGIIKVIDYIDEHPLYPERR